MTSNAKSSIISRHLGVGEQNKTYSTAARDAVFNTNELLENILLQLPPGRMRYLKGVARTWRDLILGSPAIQSVCALSPTGDQLDAVEGPKQRWDNTPLYAMQDEIEFLPVMAPSFEWESIDAVPVGKDGAVKLTVFCFQPALRRHMLDGYLSSQVVNAPCKALRVYLWPSSCTVYPSTGVTVQHLLDAVDAMVETQSKYPPLQGPQGNVRVFIAFYEHYDYRRLERKFVKL